MLLKDLLVGCGVQSCPHFLENAEVADIKIDHRQVQKGDIFIALKGENHNGNDFALQALEKGAVCVISEEDLHTKKCVKVDNSRAAYAIASKHFFGDACDDLRVIAVTGTNGKTTVANTVASVLETAGARVGVIGTLGARFNGKNLDTGFTTPDPYLLHKLFAQMKNEGQEFVVMEASAHALALDKLEGIKFEMGVLTNITEDHLDFFGDMASYAKAKFRLFKNGRVKMGIVYGDTDYYSHLLSSADVPIITYGVGDRFDVSGGNIKQSFAGSRFVCNYMGAPMQIQTPLVGGYNIENALASIAVCRSLGIDEKLIQLGMSCLTPVEGRFNVISINGQNVIIDFAHTPDGLAKVLETAKELAKGKVVAIFGCGGNRDRLKRPIMGAIASKLADEVVLTSDNPRFEEPIEIIREIQAGISGNLIIEPNRKKAIEISLQRYNNGETIVIAGKGGERYQEIKGRKYPYNDFDVVYNYFRRNIKPVEKLDAYEEENDIK
ncbi:MAG: UDP-N-acetylmuramoyl-L-alanyl-D-glutamate--2,6-diaminopimelate ligase [Clostridia bacterium]|nr:UDP-N-acetylmuramoyl-L-alanyl-D-glutamate--2,6-diaminopimelate ligase [Clostridia bacterium]